MANFFKVICSHWVDEGGRGMESNSHLSMRTVATLEEEEARMFIRECRASVAIGTARRYPYICARVGNFQPHAGDTYSLTLVEDEGSGDIVLAEQVRKVRHATAAALNAEMEDREKERRDTASGVICMMSSSTGERRLSE